MSACADPVVSGGGMAGSQPGGPASAGSSPARPSFRRDIDGLRAVAILAVVAYHVGLPGVSAGFIGVDVFFVISGYLITRNLLAEAAGSGGVALRSFWARRIRRLVPAMSLVVAATLVASALVLPVTSLAETVRQGGAASLYLSNVLFARELGDYFAGDIRSSPFLHTWSLGVEEQFYVVWPLLVGLVAWPLRRRPSLLRPVLTAAFALVLVASFVVSLRLTDRLDPWAFYGLHSRAWEFAAAGLLAAVTVPPSFGRPVARTVSAVTGLALIGGTAVMLSGSTPYPGAWALLPVTGTALLIVAGTHDDAGGVVGALLASRPAQWLGRVSYSWYLWHWPFIILMGAQFGPGRVVKVAAAGLSLLVAAAGYRFVENPVRFSPRLSASRGRTFLLGVALTVGALLVGVLVREAGDRFRRTAVDDLITAAEADRAEEACQHQDTSPSGIEYCVAGDRGASRTVLLAGDSHARHWSRTFSRVAASEGVRLVGRWLGSCPAVEVQLTPSSTGREAVEACERFREDTRQLIEELRPDAVVFSNAHFYLHRIVGPDGDELGRADGAALWGERFREMLDRPRSLGIGVGLIRDSPHLAFDPLACIAEERSVAACHGDRAETLGRTEPVREAEDAVLADLPELPTMSVVEELCDAEVCRVGNERFLYYYDGTHLTEAFTASREPQLRQLLRAALAGAD